MQRSSGAKGASSCSKVLMPNEKTSSPKVVVARSIQAQACTRTSCQGGTRHPGVVRQRADSQRPMVFLVALAGSSVALARSRNRGPLAPCQPTQLVFCFITCSFSVSKKVGGEEVKASFLKEPPCSTGQFKFSRFTSNSLLSSPVSSFAMASSLLDHLI